MKKTTKTVMAFLTAMTMTASAMSMTAYAEENEASTEEQSEWSGWWYISHSEFKSQAYMEFTSNFVPFELEETFIKMHECVSEPYRKLIHIYRDKDDKSISLYYEYENNDGTRTIETGFLDSSLVSDENVVDSVKEKEEINSFIKSNNLKGNVEEVRVAYPDGLGKVVIIPREEEMTITEYANTLMSVSNEFQLKLDVKFYVAGAVTFKEDKFTLKGDADLNGDVDLADLTVVAKYNLSNEAYPLANDTAYANADMNGDGKVDGLDTSALIENQLGK